MASTRGVAAEVLEVVLLALGLYLVITFAIQTVHVIGLSMFPTLDDQDYLVATRIDYRLHGPQRGDIIIMRDPYDSSRDFIKRVIAVPGDELLIRNGKVQINGRLLAEPYLRHDEPWTVNTDWPAPAGAGTNAPQKLLATEYFVMGDNRNHSSDSRLFGPVQRDRIESHAWIRVLPVGHFGLVNGAQPLLSDSAPLADLRSREPHAAFL